MLIFVDVQSLHVKSFRKRFALGIDELNIGRNERFSLCLQVIDSGNLRRIKKDGWNIDGRIV